MKEQVEYKGSYQVSSLGRVRSLDRIVKYKTGRIRNLKGQILKQCIDTHGYYMVNLSINGKVKTGHVHQLIAMAFLDHIPSGYDIIVDHINNDRLLNRVENIQLISARENTSKDQKNRSSQYTGVSWNKSNNKWLSCIHVDKKLYHLGRFLDEKEASDRYQSALAYCQENGFTYDSIIRFKNNTK